MGPSAGVSSSKSGSSGTQSRSVNSGSSQNKSQAVKGTASAKAGVGAQATAKADLSKKDGISLSKEVKADDAKSGVNLGAWNDAKADKSKAATDKTKDQKPNEDLAASLGSKTLKSGMHDESVRSLQSALNDKLGLELETDGKFGNKTKDAVMEFQRQNGLKPDGKVGPKTRDALTGMGGKKDTPGDQKNGVDGVDKTKTGEDKAKTDDAAKTGEDKAKTDEQGKPGNKSWGQKLTDGQKKAVDQMVSDLKAKGFNVKADDVLNFMATETAGTFSPSMRSGGKKGGAVGLAQFTQTAINDMNRFRGKGNKLSKSKLASMSFADQSKVVTEYLSTALGRKGMKGKNVGASDLYAAVFAPAAIGKSAGSTIYSLSGSAKNYRANKSLDTNHDGRITKAELTARLNAWAARGEQLRG